MTQAVPGRLRVAAGVVPGLSAMLGAGLFAGLAPAAEASGRWMLAGIGVAFLVALCGAISTADQSRRFVGVGGGYLFTRHQLGVLPGRMAGSAALAGRVCAGATIAGTFGYYVVPEYPVYGAIGVALAATVLDAFGFRPPRGLVIGVVTLVVLTLALFVVVCFAIAPPDALPVPADAGGTDNAGGLLAAAGIMFFVFMGFERVTTDQTYSVRQQHVAIPVIMVMTLAAGLAVGGAALYQLGGPRLALSPVPLKDALAAADAQFLEPFVAGVVGIATMFGVLQAVGAIRGMLSAMAEFSDVPPSLSIVGPRGVSAPSAVISGAAVAAAAALLNPPEAIGIAACLLLFYYAFTNAAARLLSPTERTWPRRVACFGLGLSVLVGMNMSVKYLVVVALVMAAGCVAGAITSRYARK